MCCKIKPLLLLQLGCMNLIHTFGSCSEPCRMNSVMQDVDWCSHGLHIPTKGKIRIQAHFLRIGELIHRNWRAHSTSIGQSDYKHLFGSRLLINRSSRSGTRSATQQ
ncbi:hypothetical protein BDZ91DRAFT_334655 [Kalaharituber pfeilii]|nr:hypothetical protein BDZ91DRAFT_334655 [Kalaharituber pfeilii]